MAHHSDMKAKYIGALSSIGIALAIENKNTKLLEAILTAAMDVTHADGCTLYLLTENKTLAFSIFANKSLNIRFNHIINNTDPVMNVSLYDSNGNPNLKNISSCCFLENCTLNIKDAYQDEKFDFTGMMKFDANLGYHSKSFLSVPLRNHEKANIGVMQLINAIDPKTNKITSFSEESVQLVEALGTQAAIAITILDLVRAQKVLYDALVLSISTSKSK